MMDGGGFGMVGKVGRVTGRIAPDRTGEVVISIRGGTEAFLAHAVDRDEVIPENTRVVVVEHYPPRTVYVSPA
jgi:hypothetical protein